MYFISTINMYMVNYLCKFSHVLYISHAPMIDCNYIYINVFKLAVFLYPTEFYTTSTFCISFGENEVVKQAKLFHMIFTRTEQLNVLTELTWNSCDSSSHAKFNKNINFMWSSININFMWKISACVSNGCSNPSLFSFESIFC